MGSNAVAYDLSDASAFSGSARKARNRATSP